MPWGSLLSVCNATRFSLNFVGHLDLLRSGRTYKNLENIKIFIAIIYHVHVQMLGSQKNSLC